MAYQLTGKVQAQTALVLLASRPSAWRSSAAADLACHLPVQARSRARAHAHVPVVRSGLAVLAAIPFTSVEMLSFFLFASLLASFASGIIPSPPLPSVPGPAGPATVSSQGPGTPSRLDYLLLMMRSQGDVAQLRMADLALNRSRQESILSLARLLRDYHTPALQSKRALALATGTSPVYEPSTAQQAVCAGLGHVNAQLFDVAWSSAQVVLHLQAIDLALSHTRLGDVSAFVSDAQQELPVLEQHLAMAQALTEQLNQQI